MMLKFKSRLGVLARFLSVSGIRLISTAASLIVVWVVLDKYGAEGTGYYFYFALYRVSGVLAPFVEASAEQLFSHFSPVSVHKGLLAARILRCGALVVLIVGIPLAIAIHFYCSTLTSDPIKAILIGYAILCWPFELAAELCNINQRIRGSFEAAALYQFAIPAVGISAFYYSQTLELGFFLYAWGIVILSLLQWMIVFNPTKIRLRDLRRSIFVLLTTHRVRFRIWLYSVLRSIVAQTDRWGPAILMSVSTFGLYSVLLRVVGILKLLFPNGFQISWFYDNTPIESFRRQFRGYQTIFFFGWLIFSLAICSVDLKFFLKQFELGGKDLAICTMFIPLMIYTSTSIIDLWRSTSSNSLLNGVLVGVTLVKVAGFSLIASYEKVTYFLYLSNLATFIYLLFFDKFLASSTPAIREEILSRRELYVATCVLITAASILTFTEFHLLTAQKVSFRIF